MARFSGNTARIGGHHFRQSLPYRRQGTVDTAAISPLRLEPSRSLTPPTRAWRDRLFGTIWKRPRRVLDEHRNLNGAGLSAKDLRHLLVAITGFSVGAGAVDGA